MKKNHINESENNKNKVRFRALDVVIILLVLATVVGVYFRYNILDALTSRRDLKEYTVSFSVEDIRYTTPNYMKVGDTVYFADSGDEIGKLIEASDDTSNIALSITPASELFLGSDGNYEEIFYPNSETRVDATGRMICIGTYSDESGFLLGGTKYIAPGDVISVKTELVTVSFTIQEIELAQ